MGISSYIFDKSFTYYLSEGTLDWRNKYIAGGKMPPSENAALETDSKSDGAQNPEAIWQQERDYSRGYNADPKSTKRTIVARVVTEFSFLGLFALSIIEVVVRLIVQGIGAAYTAISNKCCNKNLQYPSSEALKKTSEAVVGSIFALVGNPCGKF